MFRWLTNAFSNERGERQRLQINGKRITMYLDPNRQAQNDVYLEALSDAMELGIIRDDRDADYNSSQIEIRGLNGKERKAIEELYERYTLRVTDQEGINRRGALMGAFMSITRAKNERTFTINIDSKEAVDFANRFQEALETGEIKGEYTIQNAGSRIIIGVESRGDQLSKTVREIAERADYSGSAAAVASGPGVTS